MKPPSAIKPHVIMVVGIPGSGKSFFAEQFAKTFRSPIISYEKIKKDFQTKQTAPTATMTKKIADYMLTELLKTGRTIVYDGPTVSKADRDTATKIFHAASYRPMTVWVQTDPITARKRSIKITAGKKALTGEQFESKIKQFEPPTIDDATVVVSGKHPYSAQLKIVLKSIATASHHPDRKPTR